MSVDHPLLAKKLFPNDEKAKEAQGFAETEIERLNELLAQHGAPGVGMVERPILVTYIKAKRLGLLDA